MAHEGVETSESKENPNEQPLKKIFAENADAVVEGASFNINSLPYDRWATMLSVGGGILLDDLPKKSYNDFTDKLEDVFYKNSWKNLNLQERIEKIDKFMEVFCKSQKNSEDQNLSDKLKELYEQSRKFKSVKNKSEMISTLDTDILESVGKLLFDQF